MRLGRRHWLAALAILFVLFTPYQTLVQTVITDDAVRKGIEADEYDMTWVTVAYGVGVHLRRLRGAVALGPDRQALHAGPGDARVLRRQRPLRRGDRARRPGLRPIRRGVRQDAGDGGRPRHALQAVRPRAAGGHRLLRHLRLLDAAYHAAGQRLPRRVSLVAVDVLGLRAGRPRRGGPGLAVHPPRPAAAADASCRSTGWPSRPSWPGSWRSCSPSPGTASGAAGPRTPSPPRSPSASPCRWCWSPGWGRASAPTST